MTPRPERSLPLRVLPSPGESLDSWLERTARRSGLPVRRLLPVLGLPTGQLGGHHALVSGTPTSVLRRMERQAGLQLGRLDTTVVERYAGLGWEPLRGSRYCPQCLSEHSGRWAIRWRLPWVFACTGHLLLMPDRCPGCGQMPRRYLAGPAGLHPPGTCPNLIRRGQLCGTDLTAAPCQRLTQDDPRMSTQRWINHGLDRVEAGQADAVTDLTDVQAVITWLRSRCTAAEFAAHGPPAVRAFTRYMTLRTDGHRPEQFAFTDPLLVAAVASHAVALLRADTPDTVMTYLAPLLGRGGHVAVNSLGRPQPVKLSTSRWRTLSPGLQQRLLHTVDTHLSPLDRLRYRSCTAYPRLPDQAAAVAQRARWIPQLLWPDWTIRLLPAHGFFTDTLRAVLSTALLMPGNPQRRLATITAHLRPHHLGAAPATVILGRLNDVSTDDDVLEVICRITDLLDTRGAPIDYQRRRSVITTDLLSAGQWRDVCFAADAHPGEDRRHLDARRYLYQQLTGNDLTTVGGNLAMGKRADRSAYLAFVASLTTPLRHQLHEYAAAHLRGLGIDEPVTWAPPGHLADGLVLPGRDPDDIDLTTITRLVIEQEQTLGAVARTLGTSIDHIRLALDRIHRPPRQWGRNAAPATHRTQQRARALLTREFFQREYLHAGKTLRQLETETGLHRKILADYATQAGIPLKNATQREPTPIDQAWLHEQYVTQRRSFPDIAKELGVSEMTVTRAAHRHAIPVRPAGITSHPHIITSLGNGFPPDVRAAAEGQLHGWLRLRRFQQAMAHPSLTTAAGHLGVHISALVTQLQRLERDIGTPLFHRGTRNQPMRPTEHGAKLLDTLNQPQIHALLEEHGQPIRGWAPDDPRRTRPPQATAG
ncbi:TniQ family protein [Dactylosporangium sucinum]|uniref:HTH lysR-type domain-containing protein n=1 Tax=Dactylosporangium sucinum TaxID=1424081 RepID=A0A917UGV8_9ACTN|nr:TniQ family protein [Dactylosporangium sucinum]GGM88147.1 hypothetical protein GCM10007977_107660 [Dactylosporangium sucinum]